MFILHNFIRYINHNEVQITLRNLCYCPERLKFAIKFGVPTNHVSSPMHINFSDVDICKGPEDEVMMKLTFIDDYWEKFNIFGM